MSTFRRAPLAIRAPWTVVVAGVLIVPGTMLSLVFPAIGAVMLVALGVDHMARGGDDNDNGPRLPVAAQLAIGAGATAAIGAGIALGAWII